MPGGETLCKTTNFFSVLGSKCLKVAKNYYLCFLNSLKNHL